ncbi:ribonuclease 1-like [Corylus avellana]|uniref:ribonuclease 1-like n=1 Tax=Corylus avellana TaxID=13451 RepID=UPI00286CF1DB|nr:ribonuclease 1-like [Corylus avellana]
MVATKVYLFACFLVLVTGIYFHRVPPPRDLNHQDIYDSFQGVFPDAEDYDHFYLVLQWPPTFCNLAPNKCHKNATKFTYFTIHGLWPQKKNGGGIICTSGPAFDYDKLAREKKLIERMKKFWPNLRGKDEQFWGDEWNKHGRCIGLEQNDYFNRAANVYANENISSLVEELEKHEIHEGKSYRIEQYKEAIKSSRLNVTPNFQCNEHGQVQQLLEVKLCVCKKGTKFQDCTYKVGQCSTTSLIRFPHEWNKITHRPDADAVEENFRIALSAP